MKNRKESIHDSLKNDMLAKIFAELTKFKKNDRLVLLVAHGFLELMVNELVIKHCKNHKKILNSVRDYPHSAKLLLLNELKIIPDNVYSVYDWYRKLRNKSAHEPLFKVTHDDIPKFVAQKYSRANNFYQITIYMLMETWNSHLESFLEAFAPTLYKVKMKTIQASKGDKFILSGRPKSDKT